MTRLVVWLVGSGHAPDLVLGAPGLKITEPSSGRGPDIVLLRHSVSGDTVWIDPAAVILVLEVVSEGSRKLDRLIKSVEYAGVGIPHFWRVEPYVGRRVVLLDELLSQKPPLAP